MNTHSSLPEKRHRGAIASPCRGSRRAFSRRAAAARACVLAAFIALSIALWLVTDLARAAAPSTPYQVIVHPTNPIASVDRAFIAQGFLKKITSWGHGGVIRPVDLTRDSVVRRQFSEDALGRSVAAVKSYWQQMIFSGRGVPPPELPSDDDVIRYVLREPGAIGYVSSGIDLKGARAVEVH